MAYKIYHSIRFDKELSKFDSYFREQVDKIESQLIENPYVGDALNVKWFREKRIGKYRIYYLIYWDIKSVFMVAISGKKDQQKVINTIRLFLDSLREEIEDFVNEKDIT
jgi:mRNA-degrading endonuclease RelE of RelBE toxin-antitoxin system